jgi:PPOX class probable FMN-dependent enzyme
VNALDTAAIQATIGEPLEFVVAKRLPVLDAHCRRFIELAPFLCLGTVGPDGDCDVSPRGDPPGFVRILDDRTLAIPERPGNRLADSLRNVAENGHVGMLFIVPGIEETLRVNGRGRVTDDAELLASMTAGGKPPRLAIVVDVEEAFLHCAKAFKRSRLWDPAAQVERSALPTLGQILRDQVTHPDTADAEKLEVDIQEEYRTQLY